MEQLMERPRRGVVRPTGGIGRTIEAYDSMASEYAAQFDAVELTTHRHDFMHDLARGSRVLDAGCGHGRDCGLFERDGLEVVGLDLSDGLLAEARRRTTAPLVRGDVRALPLAAGSVDGVWSCAVLHHLDPDDLLLSLRETSRVLRVGGPLFVTVRAGDGEELRPYATGQTRWFRFYTEELLHHLLGEAGFTIGRSASEPGVVAGTWLNVHATKT